MSVVTRFAPSPTGFLHVGGARTALFNWLYARHHGGTFLLRIEDTDQARSTAENVQVIFEGMRWLGLDWDGDAEFQTKRLDRYDAAIDQLIAGGHAYRCDCPPERLTQVREAQAASQAKLIGYDRHCRERQVPAETPHVVRLRVPDAGDVGFADLVHERIPFDAGIIDDFVLRRTDGLPTYNFAVVVDDHDMAVTHVIRGDDHIANTPKQILVYRALGWSLPHFAHIPMILGADKQKLSKRHGATSVTEYEAMGILPEAMVNFLARLGWAHGDQEVFSREELVEFFDFDHVNKTAAVFDMTKLEWLNGLYIREKLSAEQLIARMMPLWQAAGLDVAPYDTATLAKIVESLRPRAKTLIELLDGSRFYFEATVTPSPEDRAKAYTPEAIALLAELHDHLAGLGDWTLEALEAAFRGFLDAKGLKPKVIFPAVRLALTGKLVSPGLWEVAEALGRTRTLARLAAAGHAQ